VADERALATAKRCSQAAPVLGDPSVADAVGAPADWMQPPCPDHLPNSPQRIPKLPKLSKRNHSMLPSGQTRQIVVTSSLGTHMPS
jgi:hypothetical protein